MAIAMANGEIHIFAREIDVMHGRGDPQVDRRMRLGKAAEPVHEPFGGKIGRGAHRQHARTLPLHQALGPHGNTIERVAHHGEIIAAGVGDDQPLPLAVEELDAELGFERLDLMADRALGDAELRGGAGKADMPGGAASKALSALSCGKRRGMGPMRDQPSTRIH
jgi:hypothetical protein